MKRQLLNLNVHTFYLCVEILVLLPFTTAYFIPYMHANAIHGQIKPRRVYAASRAINEHYHHHHLDTSTSMLSLLLAAAVRLRFASAKIL